MRTWVKDIERLRASREPVPPPSATPSGSLASPSVTEPESLQIRNGSQYLHPSYHGSHQTYDDETGVSDLALWNSITGTGGSRARSATQSSASGSNRHRFPMPEVPPLHTQFPSSLSPGERPMMSYFSPADTASTRSSQSTSFFNSKLGTPTTTLGEETVNRHTAPAMPRTNSRDGSNHYPSGSKPQRPSLPAYASHSQYPAAAQARFRSASSPDIHNNLASNDSRRLINGTHAHTMQTVDNVPVPPIPSHVAGVRAPITPPTGSPPNFSSNRPSHQSTSSHYSSSQQPPLPQTPTSNLAQSSYTSGSDQETPSSEAAMPAQLKAKVNFNDNYVTLVIPLNIMFRSLTDRVDAKLKRFTDQSIGDNTVRLRYRDEDGDFITIDSDEAVQLAFMDWRDQHQEKLASGLVGEIHLFCQPI
ncbi:Phox/Bem1p [Ascosphaera apis ARSEF 7405]|uniref:Phox/Bem1p n=1 Tax=Ascosphaera apis ARSEF 7405 TaxID=392613 RepID=A0A167Z901_9EURO|nr:Phox/Bem1p [Ascosphaera apis ARSEF 7405]